AGPLLHITLGAAAQNVTIEVRVDPDDPDIGWDVSLTPSGVKSNLIACHWYRGETNNFFEILAYEPPKNTVVYGPASRQRETIRPDCALLIRNVIVTDSDFYAVYKKSANRSEVGTTSLIVRGNFYSTIRVNFDTHCRSVKLNFIEGCIRAVVDLGRLDGHGQLGGCGQLGGNGHLDTMACVLTKETNYAYTYFKTSLILLQCWELFSFPASNESQTVPRGKHLPFFPLKCCQ
uniref:Immunoglobulin V-set domain-containing protein n=1 Tax=Pseudonaja textilis TaxID=8673 RepID=A0A670ZXQ3_PSETE